MKLKMAAIRHTNYGLVLIFHYHTATVTVVLFTCEQILTKCLFSTTHTYIMEKLKENNTLSSTESVKVVRLKSRGQSSG